MSLLKAKFSSIKKTGYYLGKFTHDDSKKVSHRIYSTFQEYSEAIFEALRIKDCELVIEGGKVFNNQSKVYELYNYILYSFYDSSLDLVEYKEIFTENLIPKIYFQNEKLMLRNNRVKSIKYPLLNYRRGLAIAKLAVKSPYYMDILIKFVNNYADKDLTGIIFPDSIKNAKELLDGVLKILDLKELPENG